MTEEEIQRITLAVYRDRLNANCQSDADRQLRKDNDGGVKQLGRAQAYRPIVISVLFHTGLHEKPRPAGPPKKETAAPASDEGGAFG